LFFKFNNRKGVLEVSEKLNKSKQPEEVEAKQPVENGAVQEINQKEGDESLTAEDLQQKIHDYRVRLKIVLTDGPIPTYDAP